MAKNYHHNWATPTGMPPSPKLPFKIKARAKSGRCFNGAERDQGTVRHAVPEGEYGQTGGYDKALCGTSPGLRGLGWKEADGGADAVTCPRCQRRMATLAGSAAQ